jgi:hypothetical protein
MNMNTTRALARPKSLFDMPAMTVWTLAAAGSATLALAHALAAAVARRNAQRDWPERRRQQPELRSHADFSVTDSWRVR